MPFEFFDPDADFAVTTRNLPHWEQAGAMYFITFRTADSLPRGTFDRWLRERDAWLNSIGVGAAEGDWQLKLYRMPPKTRAAYQRLFMDHFDRFLDECHGACALRDSRLSAIVATSLRHFDGDRYHLGDFVVMPNHVHLIVQFLGETKLTGQCKSWKRFTASEINRQLGRYGHFWQDESFDHLVRSEEEFQHYRDYIAKNPDRAKLRPGEYAYYRCATV